ncbi:flagellar hook-basal body protein [bacterium]|nr:flagellar hook-basal body protein [bacterium]
MVRGLYTAAAGMATIQEQTATTANNIANASTAGFKQDLLLFTSAPAIHTWRVSDGATVDAGRRPDAQYIGLVNAGLMNTEVWHDFSPGQPIATGRSLDVAITGDGFFKVVDEGGEFYTRNGQFRHSADGFLVDNFGRRVQGIGGDILLGTTNDIYFNSSGEVYAGGSLAGTLDIAFFSDPQQQLTKVGDNLWSSSGPPDGAGVAQVAGGFVERSNVNVFQSMGELIRQLRHYEAATRVITAEDDTLNIAANQLGRMPQ